MPRNKSGKWTVFAEYVLLKKYLTPTQKKNTTTSAVTVTQHAAAKRCKVVHLCQ